MGPICTRSWGSRDGKVMLCPICVSWSCTGSSQPHNTLYLTHTPLQSHLNDIQLHKEEQVLAELRASPSSRQELPGEGSPDLIMVAPKKICVYPGT